MLAVKELKLCPASKGAQQSLLSEIQLLRRLSHPAIVAYITFIKMKEYLYIAMEYFIFILFLKFIFKNYIFFPSFLLLLLFFFKTHTQSH